MEKRDRQRYQNKYSSQHTGIRFLQQQQQKIL